MLILKQSGLGQGLRTPRRSTSHTCTAYMKDRASCYNCILQIYQFWYTLHAIIPIVMYNACKNNKNETIRDFIVFQKFCANSSCKLSFAFRANITTANYNIFVLFAFSPLLWHITEVQNLGLSVAKHHGNYLDLDKRKLPNYQNFTKGEGQTIFIFSLWRLP